MFRSIHIWGPGWIKAWLRRPLYGSSGTRHILLAVADHFEPLRDGLPETAARNLVREWLAEYKKSFAPFRDTDGCRPKHTFFYPGDAYDRDCVDLLAEFCAAGWGETEIQLHHRNDTAESLFDRLIEFRDILRERHGLLGSDASGKPRFGFVHGNWALCNSRPDGDWCGVPAELAVLNRAGCYADFTFPSAPSPTQPRTVNTLYRAADRPDGRPRGHDYGIEIRAKSSPAKPAGSPPNTLTIIPGPLTLDWRRRKWGLLPRLENAELSGPNPPKIRRLRCWIGAHVHVRDRPDWVFVKLHTHGCVAHNRAAVLGQAMRDFHRDLANGYTPGAGQPRLHYVTAREMYNLMRAAEFGACGDPHPWRDFKITPPKLRTVDV